MIQRDMIDQIIDHGPYVTGNLNPLQTAAQLNAHRKGLIELRAQVEALSKDVAAEQDDRMAFVNELCAFIPESWDSDAAAESIVLDFLKTVTERLTALGGSLEKDPEDGR